MLAHDVNRLMYLYPKIFLACHTRHFIENKSGTKLTANQLRIVDHLYGRFPITLLELALQLGVTPSTMSLAIDRLTMLNVVIRKKDKTDRRRTLLTLTDKGEAIKRATTVLDRKLVEQLLSEMPEDNRNQALAGLQALADAAESMILVSTIEKPWNRKITE